MCRLFSKAWLDTQPSVLRLESIHPYFLKIQTYASRFLIYFSSLYFLLLLVIASQISKIYERSRIYKIGSRLRNVISLEGRFINSLITETHLAMLPVKGPDQTKNGVMAPYLRLRIPRNHLQILSSEASYFPFYNPYCQNKTSLASRRSVALSF